MPNVSIIIPTHSRPELLPCAVESALHAGTDVEVVVVDDASVDSTAEVCRSFEKIKYIRLEHNQGVAGARNVGILASSADFIAFLDDDDLRLPGSLDWQVDALLANKEAGFACGPILMADQEGNLTASYPRQRVPVATSFGICWNLIFPSCQSRQSFEKDAFPAWACSEIFCPE